MSFHLKKKIEIGFIHSCLLKAYTNKKSIFILHILMISLLEARPGTCPAVEDGGFGTCTEECEFDVDCPRGHKCCSNGCGHTCVAVRVRPGMNKYHIKRATQLKY